MPLVYETDYCCRCGEPNYERASGIGMFREDQSVKYICPKCGAAENITIGNKEQAMTLLYVLLSVLVMAGVVIGFFTL